MNDPMEFHRQTFKTEAHELLSDAEAALMELEEAPDDPELVGRIFRSMHTIKGSGAMFGFDQISGFTHHLEALLDRIRGGSLRVEPDLVALILEGCDQLRSMVEGGDSLDPGFGENRERLTRRILALLGQDGGGLSPQAEPVRAAQASGQREMFKIIFRPQQAVLKKGMDPLMLLDELRGLGPVTLKIQLEALPPLEKMDPEVCYVGWEIGLATSQGMNAVRDVFIFVEGEAELSIQRMEEPGALAFTPGGDPAEGGAAPAPEVRLGGKNAAAPPEKAAPAQRRKSDPESGLSSLRVSSERLDALVNLVGEMVTVQARLTQTAARRQDPEMMSVAEAVERLTNELRANTMNIRMVAIGTLLERFKRLVHDLSRKQNKSVELLIEGADTELDKTVIEKLNDPLVHLIRNALDHGLEPAEERVAAGKEPKGLLTIQARHSGPNVLISVEDDGRGLNLKRIWEKAVDKGLIAPEEELSDQELYRLIFKSGFSTARQVSDISGRGVGLDVVKAGIEQLRGTVEISSRPGQGTRIELVLPLTLAIIDGLLVRVGVSHYVIPLVEIEGVEPLTQAHQEKANGKRTIVLRGELVPYINLRERFHVMEAGAGEQKVVVGRLEGQRIGFSVDQVIGNHQTVIKSLGLAFREATDFSGATILGDGTLALILDIQRMLKSVEEEARANHARLKAAG